MLISQYDWSFANDELIFLILMIIFDRDDFFINDFSERNKRFSCAIYFRKENHHSFIFYQLFHRQQSIFQHFHYFFQIIEDDRKLNYVRCDFDYFLFESKEIRIHFFLKCASSLLMQINSKERKAIKDDESSLWKKKDEKTTKREKICRLLLKSTSEELRRFRASNITEFKNSVAATEISKTRKKISKIKETVLAIFFIDLIVFFFDWMIFFIAAKATSELV